MNWVHIWNSFTRKMTSCHHSANENRNLTTPSLQTLLRPCTHPALPALALPGPFRLLNKSLTFFKAANQKHFQTAPGCCLTGVTFYILTGSGSDNYHACYFPQASIQLIFYFTYSGVAALYGSSWKESFPWTIREKFCCFTYSVVLYTSE